MDGIISKGNSGLFQNEIELQGKYASEIRFLRDEVKIFNSFRDAYVVSAIIGFITNSNIDVNEVDNVQAASIFPEEIKKRKKDLKFIYQLIMLLDENEDFTIDDYKNRTFRDDPEEYPETLRNNMILFNSYVKKGIDFLYNKFIDSKRIDDSIDILYEIVHELAVSTKLIEDEPDLPDFTPKFD